MIDAMYESNCKESSVEIVEAPFIRWSQLATKLENETRGIAFKPDSFSHIVPQIHLLSPEERYASYPAKQIATTKTITPIAPFGSYSFVKPVWAGLFKILFEWESWEKRMFQ